MPTSARNRQVGRFKSDKSVQLGNFRGDVGIAPYEY